MCEECGGGGWFRYDVEFGHPMFGKMLPCPVCNKDGVATATGLNPMERQITFADVDTVGRPGAARMLEAAQTFMGEPTGFLTFHGGFGNAKTTVLKAIVNACVEKGISARYATMSEVMAYAREAFDSIQQGDSDYGRITKLAQVQVLVIDEMDKARVTEYAREVQTHLFDVRYRQSHALGTVVAWNGPFEAVDLPWVLSRLSQGVVVENNDPDMRPLLGVRS
jgi:DNA replication protein DnaC